MQRVQMATGGVIQSSLVGVNNKVLGECQEFEEVQIGNERFNIFKSEESNSVTLVIRGGAE